jgi:hypothetical protein
MEWVLNKTLIISLASIAIVVGYVAFLDVWQHLYNTASALDIWLIIALTTFVISTGVVMVGRYFERRLEIEARLKAQKIDIYDSLLQKLSQIFQREHSNTDLVVFITEWQSKLMLWSNSATLNSMWLWHDGLVTQNEKSLFLLDDFIRAMREEVGHSSSEIEQGAFIHLMINHGAFLKEHAHPAPEKSRVN